MINLLKSIIPSLFMILGWTFEGLSKFFGRTGVQLHILFKTDIGKKLKSYKEANDELERLLKKMEKQSQKKVPLTTTNKTHQKAIVKKRVNKMTSKMNPKLYNIIKGDENNES